MTRSFVEIQNEPTGGDYRFGRIAVARGVQHHSGMLSAQKSESEPTAGFVGKTNPNEPNEIARKTFAPRQKRGFLARRRDRGLRNEPIEVRVLQRTRADI
jgi:hypothetical protein